MLGEHFSEETIPVIVGTLHVYGIEVHEKSKKNTETLAAALNNPDQRYISMSHGPVTKMLKQMKNYPTTFDNPDQRYNNP
jgi:hypothetical protein